MLSFHSGQVFFVPTMGSNKKIHTTYITTRVELMYFPNNQNDYLFIIKRLICLDVETMLVQVYIIGLLATISRTVQ